ncbi:MAG: MFS transporter [Candidatus Binatia bacterium]|nr:MAG: MFS transporter [Candidatus Binatia bacterium]
MGRLYYGWWVVLGCVVCQMDLGFGKDAMDVYMTYIVSDLGWTRADFQLAGWVLLASYSVASPAVGYLLDRLGARTVLSLGAVSLGLVFLGYARMENFAQYLLVTLLLGFAMVAVGDIPVSTVASRWFERHRGTVLGIVLVGSNLGAAVVNLLAKELYRSFGDDWRLALRWLAFLVAFLVLPFSLFVIRDRRSDEVPPEERLEAGESESTASPSLPLRAAVRTASFWILVFALFSYYFYYLFVNRHVIALFRDHGSFGHRVPVLLTRFFGVAPDDFPEFTKSMFEVVGIPAKLLGGVLVDRLRLRHALGWNFALLAGGSLLFPFFGSHGVVVWVFLFLHGAACGLQQVLTPMAVAECFGLRSMGRVYGSLLLVLFPAHTGTWYAAYLFDTTGSYAPFYPYFMTLNVGAAASLFFLRPASRRA